MQIKQVSNILQYCIDNKTLLPGKLLHSYILSKGLNHNTFLSNRLIEFYSKCDKTISARNVFDKIPHKNIYSWNTMLDCYCKSGHLKDALQLLDEMPERNSLSWNMAISALVRSGSEEKALDVFYKMCLEGFSPTRFTLASILSACGLLAEIYYGRKCHGVAIKIGLDKNIYVGNALLSMYAKNMCIGDAIRAFGDLIEPNEVSFTAMIRVLADSEREDEAFRMFRSMHREGIRVDSVSLSSILNVCDNVLLDNNNNNNNNIHGRQIHGFSMKLGFEKDLHLKNSLLDMYAKSGNMECAEIFFAEIAKVSVVSWNIMIGGYSRINRIHLSLEYMEKMLYEGFEPNEVTYVTMLTACIKSEEIEIGRRIFNKMSFPSVSSYNAMMTRYLQIENYKEVIELFKKMQFQNIRPDQTTFSIILSSCAARGFLQAGKQVHAASYRAMLDTDVYIASGLIGMYSKCNNLVIANRIFVRIPKRDIVCWNAFIAGLYENSLANEALVFFKKMLAENIFPTDFSYATALSCSAKLSSISQGTQIHSHISKNGFINDVFVGSSLIDMYCKCGDVCGARQFFDTIIFKNTVSWNAMIHGYAQNGRGNEALGLYKYMIDTGAKPDGITFLSVLTACSHSGLVVTGIKIFSSMELDYGVMPIIDHYTCIIDLLCRGGRFDEAEVIIDTMVYRDNCKIWEIVLSSCRVYGNVSLARRAAEELFRLDPENSAPYVLLANIYSSEGRWEEVKEIREMMKNKNVVKDQGNSWIQHNNGSIKLDDNEILVA